MREELISSAVSFLVDRKAAESALSERLQFLESKGLTAEEIQEALVRSKGSQLSSTVPGDRESPSTTADAGPSSSSQISFQSSSPQPPSRTGLYYTQPPPLPKRDWKTYFVMATTSVGVSYGLYLLAKVFSCFLRSVLTVLTD